MAKDDKNNSTSNDPNKVWSELSGTMDEVWDLTDRTFGKLTNLASIYGDRLQDKIQDKLDENWPSNWNGIDSVVGSNWTNDNGNSEEKKSDDGWYSSRHRHGCRRGRDHKMWAYPVPSVRQYDRCVENNGTSVWNRDGVWRCLFPETNRKESLEITKSSDLTSASTSATPLEDRQWFTDYSVYLDWRRAMRKAEAAKREQEWQRIKEKRDSLWSFPSRDDSSNTTTITSPTTSDVSSPSTSLNTNSNATKFVSESEASKQGKNVISSAIISETVSRDDGTLETKRIVKKWYDDNTVSVSETINSGDNNLPSSDSNSKGGWFWK